MGSYRFVQNSKQRNRTADSAAEAGTIADQRRHSPANWTMLRKITAVGDLGQICILFAMRA